MNKRIKELLGQAYDEAVPETWTTLSSEQLGRIYEKFAELIVGECANYLDAFNKENMVEEGMDGAYMKAHFGVEE